MAAAYGIEGSGISGIIDREAIKGNLLGGVFFGG
jgi:hypothetical protein